ncbi:unnamed protein product [Dovyalis caffra]|uniref:Uncharacterized protein n=1 Tax=Dovyalis caffra TaxID=77055 RepID=A0AAV1QZW9_9ROSI|nr:unnamed protein product [Dovyalis caffra]
MGQVQELVPSTRGNGDRINFKNPQASTHRNWSNANAWCASPGTLFASFSLDLVSLKECFKDKYMWISTIEFQVIPTTKRNTSSGNIVLRSSMINPKLHSSPIKSQYDQNPLPTTHCPFIFPYLKAPLNKPIFSAKKEESYIWFVRGSDSITTVHCTAIQWR